jgi:hypothetical protein
LIEAFATFCRPILESGSVVWNSIRKSDARAVESVQRYFTRRVAKRCGFPRHSYSERLAQFDLVPLSLRRELADLCFAHSVYHGRHVCPILAKRVAVHSYTLSHSMRLSYEVRPKPIRARFAANRLAALWNSLPDRILSLKPAAFRCHAKRFLLSRDPSAL